MKILYLDKTGKGGCQRSLQKILKHLSSNISYEVKVLNGYKPSERKNLWVLFLFLIKFIRYVYEWWWIRHIDCDILHVNHDSLFVYALWFPKPVIYHMRTIIPENMFGKIQATIINRTASYLVFISVNERNRFVELTGNHICPNEVIYNVAV